MKNMLIALALLVVSSPLYAQSSPVQIACFKGGYKPMCNSLKKEVNQSPNWHQTKRGPRYVVVLGAHVDPQTGLVSGAASFAANLDDPVSSQFPHLIEMVTFAIGTSSASTAGPVLVEILTKAALDFAASVASLNQYGTAGPDFSDVDELPMRFLTDDDLLESDR